MSDHGDSPHSTAMLGSAFIQLSSSLQTATSFEQVADLLCRDLPPMIGGDTCLIRESSSAGKILAGYGDSPLSQSLNTGGKTEALNRIYKEHPLFKRIVHRDPGDLGITSSDIIPPDEYKRVEFNLLLHDGKEMEEAMFGKLLSHADRHTMLVVFREQQGYTKAQRQVFDAILFTARAVLQRICSQAVESAVRHFLISSSPDSPVAIFIVQPDGQTLPSSYEALRLSEQWWNIDEPYRKLSDPCLDRLRENSTKAWKNPATAKFFMTEIDLGGGMMPCHALPKINGEIILIMPVSGIMPSQEETLNALLTRRQREIMEWISEGKTSAEIAIILHISPRTVEKHLEAVFQRLGVENRIAAVRRFLELKGGPAL